MTKEQQRAIVATVLMKYHDSLVPTGEQGLEYVYFTFDSKTICLVTDYHPDLEDRDSLGQADDLLTVLAEQECIVIIHLGGSKKMHKHGMAKVQVELIPKEPILKGFVCFGNRWNAALLEAASKLAMELAKELK